MLFIYRFDLSEIAGERLGEIFLETTFKYKGLVGLSVSLFCNKISGLSSALFLKPGFSPKPKNDLTSPPFAPIPAKIIWSFIPSYF